MEDDFKGAQVIPGLEHLGRALVDAKGQPSGSPANFEYTRGASAQDPGMSMKTRAIPQRLAATSKDVVSALLEEFPPETK